MLTLNNFDSFWITAEMIHNGKNLVPQPQYIHVSRKGQILDISNSRPIHSEVMQLEGILAPAFINAHCHLELSHLKGQIAHGKGLVQFLLDVMKPYGTTVTDDIISKTIEDAKNRGIIAFGDISNTTNTLFAKNKAQIRCHTFVEALGKLEAKASDNYNRFISILNAFKENENAYNTSSLTLHAPYSIAIELAKLVDSHSPDSILSIHSQESLEESKLFVEHSGQFIEFYEKIGVNYDSNQSFDGNSLDWILSIVSSTHTLLLIHNTFSNHGDWIKIANRPNTHVCLCPKANLYIENTLPNVKEMSEIIDNICIGTDSLASNDSIDILSEIKILNDHFPEIGIEKLLKWATHNGAKALKFNNLGEIKIGNKCHLVNISEDLNHSRLIV